MAEYRVVIPEPQYSLIEFRQEGLPGLASVNTALRDFEPKVVFAWHLSLVLRLQDLIEYGLPSPAERNLIDKFEDVLDLAIKGDEKRVNAVLLAAVTWNATRELIWRVYEPEPVHNYLQSLIEANFQPRPFDYRMEHDPEWKLAEWHLERR